VGKELARRAADIAQGGSPGKSEVENQSPAGDNQVEHHQRQSLYEEIAALLAKHGGVMEEFDWWKE
jgi:hypothetical protein